MVGRAPASSEIQQPYFSVKAGPCRGLVVEPGRDGQPQETQTTELVQKVAGLELQRRKNSDVSGFFSPMREETALG